MASYGRGDAVTDLLPCPWCLTPPRIIHVENDATIMGGWYVGCQVHHEAHSMAQENAIRLWNTRHVPPHAEATEADVKNVAEAMYLVAGAINDHPVSEETWMPLSTGCDCCDAGWEVTAPLRAIVSKDYLGRFMATAPAPSQQTAPRSRAQSSAARPGCGNPGTRRG